MRWWWLCQNSVVATINHKNSNKHMAGVQEGGLVVDVAWRWHPMCQGEQGAMNNVLLHGVMINDAGGWGGGNCNSARWLSRGHYWLQQGRQWCQQQQMMIFAVVGGGGVAGCGWGDDRQTPCTLLKCRQWWSGRQQQWHRRQHKVSSEATATNI